MHDSVTSHPPSTVTMSYRHTLSGGLPGVPTPKAKVLPGSHEVTVQVVQ